MTIKYDLKCKQCEKKFSGQWTAKYCSSACRQKAYRRSRGVTNRNKYNGRVFD